MPDYFASVSHASAIFGCVYDDRLGFMCGRCRGLLGWTPKVGQLCKCGARVEEASYRRRRRQHVDDAHTTRRKANGLATN